MSASFPASPKPPQWQGIMVAALTPMDRQGRVLPQAVPALLHFWARQGVHGVLLLGTTGEGPSLSPEERRAVLQAAATARPELPPHFRLLVGTGTPSLEETVQLTRTAFDLGLDGVVVLPPYYFPHAQEEGLWAWFAQVMHRAVPEDGAFFLYHFPQMTRQLLTPHFLARLKEAFPRRLVGLKDSSGDPAFLEQLQAQLGDALRVFVGHDGLLLHGLRQGAAGAITALANLRPDLLLAVWQAWIRGNLEAAQAAQHRLTQARQALEALRPFPPAVKALGTRLNGWPLWGVKPPLQLPSGERVEPIRALLADL